MSIAGKAKRILRPLRNVLWALFGFGCDFSCCVRYGGWREHGDGRKRDCKAVKTYHSLEKGLSFRQRRSGSDWDTAEDLTSVQPWRHQRVCMGYQETAGVKVLRDFVACSDGGGQVADR